MTHVRQQIREAVVASLNNISLIGNNVYPSRVDTLTDKHLPCICVYTKEEKSKRITMGGLQERELEIVLELVIKSDTDFDNTLDNITAEIEPALINNQALKSLIKDIDLSETTIATGGSGEKILGIASIIFRCIYHTQEGVPETAL